MATQSPFLVKKKIVEKGKLEGVILMNQDKLYKLGVQELLGLLADSNKKRIVLVDYSGADNPATLTVVHKKVADGLRFHFKTVHDKTKKNNFNKVPKIRLISSKKYPILKL